MAKLLPSARQRLVLPCLLLSWPLLVIICGMAGIVPAVVGSAGPSFTGSPLQGSPGHHHLRNVIRRATPSAQVPDYLKKGKLYLIDGAPMELIDCFADPRSSIVKTKLKNLQTGVMVSKTWKDSTRLQQIRTLSKPATYSYFDDADKQFVFMDCETFEEIRLDTRGIGEMANWLTEGMQVNLQLYGGRAIKFGIPSDLIAEVVSIKMDLSHRRVGGGKGHKFVVLSNGLTKRGPHYLKVGDKVVIDPQSGDILRRL